MQKIIIPTLVFATLTLAALVGAPAHAIDHKYAKQLDWSGCTETNADTTCNINKPKSWNDAHSQKAAAAPAQSNSDIIREAAKINGMTGAHADSYLIDHGWSQPKVGVWTKAGHRITTAETHGVVTKIVMQ